MFITTVTKGDDTTYRLHRGQGCKALNDSKRTVEEQLANDPQIVLDAKPCSTCKPSKAVQVSVRTEAEKAQSKKTSKRLPNAQRTTTGGKPMESAATAELDAAVESTEKPAEDAKTESSTGRGRSIAVKDGEQKCETCGKVLPLTKFPTLSAKAGEVPARGKTCREDIKKAREAKKAAPAAK